MYQIALKNTYKDWLEQIFEGSAYIVLILQELTYDMRYIQ